MSQHAPPTEQDLADLLRDLDKWTAHRGVTNALCHRAAAVIRELAADKERLDWIEAARPSITPSECLFPDRCEEWEVDTDTLGYNRDTLRKAIDAAIAAESADE